MERGKKGTGKYQVTAKELPVYAKGATNLPYATGEVLYAPNTIQVIAVGNYVAPNGNHVSFAKFILNGNARFVKLAGLQQVSNADGDAPVEEAVKAPVITKSTSSKTKLATGVFVTAALAGIILPLIFAPSGKKVGLAVLYGAFGVLVGGGISLGLSGKLKDV